MNGFALGLETILILVFTTAVFAALLVVVPSIKLAVWLDQLRSPTIDINAPATTAENGSKATK